MASIKQSKPKIMNTLDSVITNLQAESTVQDVEWQAVMIARKCLASGVTFGDDRPRTRFPIRFYGKQRRA